LKKTIITCKLLIICVFFNLKGIVMNNFDLVVIGAGPGGYVAAIRAAQLGLKTAIIEKQHLGGICLNWGCIPTKALLKCSEINHLLHNLEQYGFSVDNIQFDFNKIIARSRNVASRLSSGIAHLLKKNKVEVILGEGKILSKNQVSVLQEDKTTNIQAKNIIIATGARAKIIPGFEPDENFVLTYKEAMTPKKMPKSLIVVGSGAIGVEFASFYRNMGVKVTLVEMFERILPAEDEEISAMAHKAFTKSGIEIYLSSQVKKLHKEKDGIRAILEHQGKEQEIHADSILMAVGVVSNTENLGIENTKIIVEKGVIKVDEFCQTNEPGIYAIGDVIHGPWLAHKASHEGILVAEKLAGKNNLKPINKLNIPGCTYSMPQIASIGLTEKQAKEKGLKIKVGKFPFMANGKAIALGEEEGLIKTIFDEKTGELLGAHMIGAEVTEMIQGFAIHKTMEGTEEDLFHTIFPHPTLSEMMHESALSAYNRAIHF
jgi:dihydrolipoamide dehydrogenase